MCSSMMLTSYGAVRDEGSNGPRRPSVRRSAPSCFSRERRPCDWLGSTAVVATSQPHSRRAATSRSRSVDTPKPLDCPMTCTRLTRLLPHGGGGGLERDFGFITPPGGPPRCAHTPLLLAQTPWGRG